MRGEGDLVAAWKISRLVRRFGAHILHLHTAHAHALGGMAVLLSPGPTVVVSRRVDFPVAQNPPSRFKYRQVDRIIAISKNVREVLYKSGVDRSKISVVHSGIDLDKFASLGDVESLYRSFGLRRADPLVGNIAALAPHKAQDDLLRAARIVVDRIPDVRFLIVGEGKLKAPLLAQRRALRLEKHVLFTGFRTDIGEILSILDVFVLSSYLEGLGTSVLDAMLLSVPVVATRTGGIPEIVIDGETGFLVPPRTPKLLAERICDLLQDENLRRKMGDRGRRIVAKFDINHTVAQTEELYEELIL